MSKHEGCEECERLSNAYSAEISEQERLEKKLGVAQSDQNQQSDQNRQAIAFLKAHKQKAMDECQELRRQILIHETKAHPPTKAASQN